MPKGYVIANIDVTDADAYAGYAEAAKDFVERNGGTFLARGGRVEAVEGETNARVVIAEFDSYAQAKEVADGVLKLAQEIRGESGAGSLIATEGVD